MKVYFFPKTIGIHTPMTVRAPLGKYGRNIIENSPYLLDNRKDLLYYFFRAFQVLFLKI